MIKWRSGKAGFVGGLKHAIRGLFSYQHSVTTDDVVIAPKLGRSMIADYNDRIMTTDALDRNMIAKAIVRKMVV